ncbi:fumarylacetoacetate hydrolase family protein [Microbulbifer rhizosphaerae]|uniref:Fumarylacetoacetate (FAA) hydrolase n=1 Tax=Microbulbifer rhizosphaerae TaxID=1562603 RepID=A0A7W4ZCG7_9GAMM|nr:fumarylacetoacetate hydrolase family protein [Microbulbifer rhizosphaerae]MBB3063419.1 fumarylacetoacetate (FAA) hydrolase [Microbulbifer rhizosphaerae]
MKLASLKKGRDGELIVVSRDLTRHCGAADIAPSLQAALDDWETIEPRLRARFNALQQGEVTSFPFDPGECHSPLPRAYHWADGSAYVNHVELVRKARGVEMPESFWTDPLMYQGGSDTFLAPRENIAMASTEWGIDFEAEVAVITGDVPMGTDAEKAGGHIRLLMLVNDVSLRNLIPGELAKGFGFYQSKPSSAFSPVAVTPDELGHRWRDGKVHLPLHARLNGEKIGSPNAGVDMTFNFPQLIAHAAKSRNLGAGTIIGSGTVSNVDRSSGSCCLAEVRMLEMIADGKPSTPFMQFGDRIEIAMYDEMDADIFGTIDQRVVEYVAPQ